MAQIILQPKRQEVTGNRLYNSYNSDSDNSAPEIRTGLSNMLQDLVCVE